MDVREFWRCGMTNLGAGWRVHWGGIEFADVCRVKTGRFGGFEVVLDTCTDEDLIGILFLGGIAGGGPLCAGKEFWDCIRGGIWGSFSIFWSTWDFVEISAEFVRGCIVFIVVEGNEGWTLTTCAGTALDDVVSLLCTAEYGKIVKQYSNSNKM